MKWLRSLVDRGASVNTSDKQRNGPIHIRHLKMVHPIKQGGSFDVQLLIEADFYWDLVGNKVIRGPGPTAVESKLGYLLSGPLTVDECMDVEKKESSPGIVEF